MKLTKRKLSILTLAITLILSVAILFGINLTAKYAEAAGTVTVSGSNVFTATGNASVARGAVGEGESTKYYSTFTFTSNDGTVSYRRNVAYKWQNGAGAENAGYFHMEIGFKNNTSFEKFIVTFESQQYNKTKDGKTKNYVMFFPAETAGYVNALITDDENATADDVEDKTVVLTAGATDRITIEFTEKYADDFTGGYKVSVKDANEHSVTGEFKNVGGNYAKYSSSSTTPVYPLIFKAVFDEEATENKAEVAFFELNGQVFETTSSTANTVTDKAAPVLCLTEDIKYFDLNGELDVDYIVIDVLRSSPPSPTVYYYILDKDGLKSEEKDYKYLETKSSSNVILSADSTKYLPSDSDLAGTAFAPTYNKELVANTDKDKPLADMLIKVYFKLTDTSTEPEEATVYLDWYVDDYYTVNYKYNEDGDTTKFLAVAKDGRGATYNYDGVKDGENTKTWTEIKDEYQAKVDELSKNLSAGSSSYFYLPSVESLFSDNATAYTDMKFSIYYYHESKQSSTNLASSNLSINITKKGKYTFTVYATDAAGNNMYYLEEVTEQDKFQPDDLVIEDKHYKTVEFKSSEVWTMFDDKDNGLYDKLPWFTFDVGYNGVEFEKTPGLQSTAYVGTAYTSAKFDINGISGSYDTKYRLFLFNSAKYYNENNNATFSYEEFIEKMDGLFADPATRVYFEEIPEVKEGDADYDTYKDYGWSNSSTTFTPQDANAFYYIRAEVKDKEKLSDPITCSLAVIATETAKTIKGESDWLKNNVASIVLLVVAGVALIGIVLLLVIKPKKKEEGEVKTEKASAKTENKDVS